QTRYLPWRLPSSRLSRRSTIVDRHLDAAASGQDGETGHDQEGREQTDGEMSTLELIDEPDSSGRTTATLLASLAAPPGVLMVTTGADVIGSITAGLVKLGRDATETAEGARLRQALLAGRAGANGETLWRVLRIDDLALRPPTGVLEQLRNDLALLLADDLD